MTPASPGLSVICACSDATANAADRIARLTRLTTGRDNAELIVVSQADSGAASGASHVRFIRGPVGATLPDLLGLGLRHARHDFIAITDARSAPADDWVARLQEIRGEVYEIGGGAVEPGTKATATDWAAYWCEYAQFMLPLADGAARELPGNNIFFRRELADLAPSLTRPAFWKTQWCEHLIREGVILRQSGDLVVEDAKSYAAAFLLRRRFHHGRCYAGRRFPPRDRARRAAYAAGSLALPALLLWRVARTAIRKRRFLLHFARALPVIVLAQCAWSAGECAGYALGPGRSCDWVK